jgi:hypothetical protein
MNGPVPPGLCASCRHHRIVETRRGSRFVLCARSRTEPDFPRYPALPVVACRGYESDVSTATPHERDDSNE